MPNLEQLFGTEGKISIESLDTDETIRAVHEKLVEAELAGNYSVELLIGKSDLFSISPVSTLQPFLAQELVRLQSELLGSLEGRLTSIPTSALDYSPFFASLTCNRSAYATLPDKQQEYLAKLCDFRAVAEKDPVTSYLFRVGGVYQDVPDVNLTIRHQQIVTELNRTQQLVHDAIAELKAVHWLVYDEISQQQRQQLANAIEKLQAARQALQDAYEFAISNQPGMAEHTFAFVKVGKDFADGIAAFYASNWITAGEKFASGVKGLGPLMVAYSLPLSSPNLTQIDEAIKIIQRDLKDFVALLQATKSDMIKSRSANLRELILTRDRLEDYRTSTRFDFASFVRASLQEYFQTSDMTTLKKNLEVIRLTINETNTSATLELPSLRQLCRGNPTTVALSQLTGKAGCVEFDRQNSYVVVSKRPVANLPLLVVSKADGSITRSFEQAFQASEIEKLPVTFEQITSALPTYWLSDCSAENSPDSVVGGG